MIEFSYHGYIMEKEGAHGRKTFQVPTHSMTQNSPLDFLNSMSASTA